VTNFDGVSCSCLAWLAQTEEERNLWLLKVFTCLTEETAVHKIASRLGWLYLKEGVGGAWRPTWFSLQGRQLKYLLPGQSIQDVDLQKARSFGNIVIFQLNVQI